MTTTRDKLREFILHRFLKGADPASLKNDVSLERSRIVDSVNMLEVILFLEEAFGITVENEDAIPENFDTIDNMVAYVERKRA